MYSLYADEDSYFGETSVDINDPICYNYLNSKVLKTEIFMQYKEDIFDTKEYKGQYAEGLLELISQREKLAADKREEYIRDIFTSPEKYRAELKRMLGYPLADMTESREAPQYSSELLSREDGYILYRMRFEVLDGLVMTGLYFEAEGEEKRPLVIVQHGGQGTPELMSGVYGSTTNYNDMLQRVRRQGVHVFAPQLLLWHDKYGVPYDRRSLDARLKRVGSSIAAVEIYGIIRVLDYFEKHDRVSCLGMLGMSYGGFYTLFTSAIDTRIKSALSCSFFNVRQNIAWSDWTWLSSAESFNDAEVACLVYPRRLYLAMGERDELFSCDGCEKEFERLRQLCREVGTDWVSLYTYDGKHEFFRDDGEIERFIQSFNS